jgi:energy-coupling factor transporter ATP-binding protein EcfA2
MLYASILGLTPAEAAARFDDIAAFADLGPYLDRPLKTYSSGMVVRLAFSVAISVDPDVLLVDEALAVGDLRFAQRCTARIRQLRDAGVTIVFVTHDLEACRRLCDEVHVLERGRLVRSGPAPSVSDWYFGRMSSGVSDMGMTASAPAGDLPFFRHGDGRGRVTAVELLTRDGKPARFAVLGQTYRVRLHLEYAAAVPAPAAGFYLRDRLGTEVLGANTHDQGRPLPPAHPGDRLTVDFVLPVAVRPGGYALCVALAADPRVPEYLDWQDNALVFEVIDPTPGRVVHGLVHAEVGVEVHAAAGT